MPKKLLITMCLLAFSFAMFGQSKKQANGNIHKIVFQLTSDDTLVHKGLMRQLNNILNSSPDSKIEIVCHGPGINMLMRDTTLVLDKIRLYKSKGVTFKVCENTLREKNISRDKIIAEADFVPSALIEIVTRQEEGWSYIKSGF